ncbi:MAG: RNA polymerase sigma factor [Clostridia bacterium]
MEYLLKEWVEKSRSGDQDAACILLDKLNPLMISIVSRYGRGEWEDLMQEARETVLRCIREYREDRNVPFVVFVRKALYYQIRNLSRPEPPVDSLDAPLPGQDICLIDRLESQFPSVQEELEREELYSLLREALQTLPLDQREVLLLHFYSGISYKEIALARGVHYQTVRGWKQKGLIQLKKILSSYINP